MFNVNHLNIQWGAFAERLFS